MTRLQDQDPEAWAVLQRTYADPDRFFPPRADLSDQARLVVAIQRFLLSKHPRRAEIDEVARAVERDFRRVPPLQLRADVRRLLAGGSYFDSFEGRYGVITSPAQQRQEAARRRGTPAWMWQAESLTPIPFIEPTTHDTEASVNAKVGEHSDVWSSWFAQLGTDAGHCHLWLTLEPHDSSRYMPRTFGVILLAGSEPSWLIYTLTSSDDLTRELNRRGWSAWLPHDHPGVRAREYVAPRRWVSEPINPIVAGAHVHTPHDAWTEFVALTSDVMAVGFDRVEARWSPIDADEVHRREQARRLIDDAFTWVNQHTPGAVYDPDRFRSGGAKELLETCMICGHDLHDEDSANQRIGPVCKKRALERIGDALDLTDTWNNAEELLERIAHSRRHIPLANWAYARDLTTASMPRHP